MIAADWRGFRHGQLLGWRASVVVGGRPSRRPGCRAPSPPAGANHRAPFALITYTHQPGHDRRSRDTVRRVSRCLVAEAAISAAASHPLKDRRPGPTAGWSTAARDA